MFEDRFLGEVPTSYHNLHLFSWDENKIILILMEVYDDTNDDKLR